MRLNRENSQNRPRKKNHLELHDHFTLKCLSHTYFAIPLNKSVVFTYFYTLYIFPHAEPLNICKYSVYYSPSVHGG
jgi:hypothetical protein